MNLMKYGYKKEEIKIRKMTMAELRLTSFGSYDVLMTEVANGFFYNGGGKITLK